MSEQNQRNNLPDEISPQVQKEMLRVPIPVIAPGARMDRAVPKDVYEGARECRFFQGHNRRHRCRRYIEIMDVILQPDIQEVMIQKSTQIQKAKTFQNLFLDSFRVADDSESMTISAFIGTNLTDELLRSDYPLFG